MDNSLVQQPPPFRMSVWKVVKFVSITVAVATFVAFMIFFTVYVYQSTENGGGGGGSGGGPSIRGSCEYQGKIRTWQGGHGEVRVHRDAADTLLRAMDANGGGRRVMKITDAESTRIDQDNAYTGRGVAIAKLVRRHPVLEVREVRQERSNADFVTMRFTDGDVYFPPSMFIHVCV